MTPVSTVPDEIALYSDPILIKGRKGTVQADFEDESLNSATVHIANDAGDILVNAQVASGSKGKFSYAVKASDLTQLDRLTITWKAGEDTLENFAEVASGYITTLADITKSLPGIEPSEEDLSSARILAELALEDACYVSFLPRYRRETNDAGILERGRLRSLREVKVNGVAIPDTSGVRVVKRRYIPKHQFFSTFTGDSTLLYPTNLSPQVVEVAYEHGWDAPPPLVARAVVRLARYFLTENPSDYDERATSISTEQAHYSLITPGVSGAIFALPEVNAVVQRYGLGAC